MMMKPAVPKPTAKYMAAKRAECKKAQDGEVSYETLREQGPFWMSQASLAYSVPNTSKGPIPSIECAMTQGIPIEESPPGSGLLGYNTVEFDNSRNQVNIGSDAYCANDANKDAERKYLAMGSFFFEGKEWEPVSGKLTDVTARYFLSAAGCKGWSIGDTEFAPAHSYILAFAGTQFSPNPTAGRQALQDRLLGNKKQKTL